MLDGLEGDTYILPEMLTILPESKTRVILLASRAIYYCIPRKRPIHYYYYSYRALCVILLSNDHGWLPAAILSLHESESLWDVATVTRWAGHSAILGNDWLHKVRAILKKDCPGNIKKYCPPCHKARGIHDFILATKSTVWIIGLILNIFSQEIYGDNGRIYQIKIYKKMLTPNYGLSVPLINSLVATPYLAYLTCNVFLYVDNRTTISFINLFMTKTLYQAIIEIKSP